MRKRIIFEQPKKKPGEVPVTVPFSVVPGTILYIVDSKGDMVERMRVRSIEMKKQKGGKRIKPLSLDVEVMRIKKISEKRSNSMRY